MDLLFTRSWPSAQFSGVRHGRTGVFTIRLYGPNTNTAAASLSAFHTLLKLSFHLQERLGQLRPEAFGRLSGVQAQTGLILYNQ